MALTVPTPLIVAVALAPWEVVNPIGVTIETDGAMVYPTPGFVISNEVTVPATDTKAVADAPTKLSWEIILISFCPV